MNKSLGDRELPLEMDFQENQLDHPLVGMRVQVSPIAGGQLKGKRGEAGEVLSVSVRLGQVVGYQVKVGDLVTGASLKDVFTSHEILEDIQPGTPTSVSLREALDHWAVQRTYWHTRLDGLESLCFALATATPRALVECHHAGWRFLIPDPMPDRHTVVDCRAIRHDNYWTISVSVYPQDGPMLAVPLIRNHWARVFTWSAMVASGMLSVPGWAGWARPLELLEYRARISAEILQPMVDGALRRSSEALSRIRGEAHTLPFDSVYAGFCAIRLRPSYIGLTEPPTDRRPYTVISISPAAMKSEQYLRQVVLHECLHVIVGSSGGDPHNEEFLALADSIGLEERFQD
jgi:hypothetical protein